MTKNVVNRGKRSKILIEVKVVENISKTPGSFQEISLVLKEAFLSHKQEDHAYEQENLFVLNEDNPLQRNCQNQWSHPTLSHIEQECQETLIEGKIHIQRNWNEDLEYS